MAQPSKYQQKVIRNYYQNRDSIALQRAQEIITELYLAEGKKRTRQWQLLANHLAKLGLPQKQIDHLIQQDNPAVVAQVVQDLWSKGS
jgi:hypothetical protein